MRISPLNQRINYFTGIKLVLQISIRGKIIGVIMGKASIKKAMISYIVWALASTQFDIASFNCAFLKCIQQT